MTTSAQTRPERRSALPPIFGYRSITVSAGRFPTAPEPRA